MRVAPSASTMHKAVPFEITIEAVAYYCMRELEDFCEIRRRVQLCCSFSYGQGNVDAVAGLERAEMDIAVIGTRWKPIRTSQVSGEGKVM